MSTLPDSYYDLPDEPEEEMHGEPDEPDQQEEPTDQQCDDQADAWWNRRDR